MIIPTPMLVIINNAGMKRIRHSGDVLMITSMGVGIIIIFSFIFLLYSNSFLMKRRQKELGLYNILGLVVFLYVYQCQLCKKSVTHDIHRLSSIW